MKGLDSRWCQERRRRLAQAIQSTPELSHLSFPLFLADPIHLNWLSGFFVDPFSLGAGFGGLLQLEKDGSACLFHHDRLPDEVAELVPDAHGLKRKVLPWYDGASPPQGIRALAMLPEGFSGRILDLPGDPLALAIHQTLLNLRRAKDPDELALLRRCAAIQEECHRWARQAIRPGITEWELYAGVWSRASRLAERATIVYGDFAVSPGPERKGGPPTQATLKEGDLIILDFSVVLFGYRCDFTTTLAVGEPSIQAREMMDLCLAAMKAGEETLRAGAEAALVHQAVNDIFAGNGRDRWFGHHAGHGLGLSHPEAPFLVPGSRDRLVANDVITLEPGLYIPQVGGMRIERNYRILEGGFETLSHHLIGFEGA